MDRGGGFVRESLGIVLKQLCEARFVEIANRAFAVWLDPFRMLRPQIVMNLKLKQGK